MDKVFENKRLSGAILLNCCQRALKMGLGQLRGPSGLTGTLLTAPIRSPLSRRAGLEVCDGSHSSFVMNSKPRPSGLGRSLRRRGTLPRSCACPRLAPRLWLCRACARVRSHFRAAVVPVPVSEALCGLFDALSVKVKVPVSTTGDWGVNVTSTLQCVAGLTPFAQ